MSKGEQVDMAVDLGVVAPGLPEILCLEDFDARDSMAPPEIIEGVLHQGCKMILGGTSKSNKSWCLLDLAMSVASGQKWWGRQCARAKALYINFELQDWAIKQRLRALRTARPECMEIGKTLHLWNLRGHNTDLSVLRPQLEEQLSRHEFGLIILDPAYKLLGNRDENANGEIANLMNEFEALARSSGAAIVVAHHYAKGDSSAKEAGDRLSGAGAWTRDPDSLVVMTPHEEPDCFTVNTILRNLPRVPEFVLSWEFPLMRLANDLNPKALKTSQTKQKICTDHEFIETLIGEESKPYGRIIKDAASILKMSKTTASEYLSRIVLGGKLVNHCGIYCKPLDSN